MRCFNTYVVILRFRDLTMKLPPDSFAGGRLDSVSQL